MRNGFTFAQILPVACFNSSSIACTLFLLLHLHIKLFYIDRQVVFVTYKFGKVKRKSKCIKQRKSLLPRYFLPSIFLSFRYDTIQHVDTR